jgi:hypothetical protein
MKMQRRLKKQEVAGCVQAAWIGRRQWISSKVFFVLLYLRSIGAVIFVHHEHRDRISLSSRHTSTCSFFRVYQYLDAVES